MKNKFTLTLKMVYILVNVLVIVFVFACFLGALLSGWLYFLALAALAAMLFLWIGKWRCPKCGKHLGRTRRIYYCPHCSQALELLS